MQKMPRIIPISDLRQDANGIIKQLSSSDAPTFITQRGRTAAVMMSIQEYKYNQHELEVLRLLARGEKEMEAGVGYDLSAVMAEADEMLAE